MAQSPTQRTLELLRKEGYLVAVVEKYNSYIKKRQDLFGWIDIIAIHPKKRGVLAVQTTTGSNLSARIKKSLSLTAFKTWVSSGNFVEFHGWRKLKNLPGNKQWDCKREIYTGN